MSNQFLPKFSTISSHLVLATALLAGPAFAGSDDERDEQKDKTSKVVTAKPKSGTTPKSKLDKGASLRASGVFSRSHGAGMSSSDDEAESLRLQLQRVESRRAVTAYRHLRETEALDLCEGSDIKRMANLAHSLYRSSADVRMFLLDYMKGIDLTDKSRGNKNALRAVVALGQFELLLEDESRQCTVGDLKNWLTRGGAIIGKDELKNRLFPSSIEKLKRKKADDTESLALDESDISALSVRISALEMVSLDSDQVDFSSDEESDTPSTPSSTTAKVGTGPTKAELDAKEKHPLVAVGFGAKSSLYVVSDNQIGPATEGHSEDETTLFTEDEGRNVMSGQTPVDLDDPRFTTVTSSALRASGVFGMVPSASEEESDVSSSADDATASTDSSQVTTDADESFEEARGFLLQTAEEFERMEEVISQTHDNPVPSVETEEHTTPGVPDEEATFDKEEERPSSPGLLDSDDDGETVTLPQRLPLAQANELAAAESRFPGKDISDSEGSSSDKVVVSAITSEEDEIVKVPAPVTAADEAEIHELSNEEAEQYLANYGDLARAAAKQPAEKRLDWARSHYFKNGHRERRSYDAKPVVVTVAVGVDEIHELSDDEARQYLDNYSDLQVVAKKLPEGKPRFDWARKHYRTHGYGEGRRYE